jgi:hypothetical protein
VISREKTPKAFNMDKPVQGVAEVGGEKQKHAGNHQHVIGSEAKQSGAFAKNTGVYRLLCRYAPCNDEGAKFRRNDRYITPCKRSAAGGEKRKQERNNQRRHW